MTQSWNFKKLEPGSNNREPIHGEFFSAEGISDPGMALIREGIQNALDAGRKNERVLVRVFLAGSDDALTAESVSSWLGDGAWDHFFAPDNGLRQDEVPKKTSNCTYFAFEDFGTKGLEGNPAQAFKDRSGAKNHFYHFFRAEGQTDKDSSNRGSWGIGKHVFWRSSRVSTAFGVTVRASDLQPLMMGKTVLKSHGIRDEKEARYQDGYFGTPPDEHQPLTMPISDAAEINRFCKRFGLQRGAEPGLSVVVPWPDEEITDQAIITGVIRHYFYPILIGQLEVIVETPTVKTALDSKSLFTEVERIGGELASELRPMLDLARWACDLNSESRVSLKMPPSDQRWLWSKNLFPPDSLKSLQKAFRDGEQIAIRVPVTVRPKQRAAATSFLDVYLIRNNSEYAGHPTFIREQIIVPNVDAPRTRGVQAIVVIDDLHLAAFLRDAENPSHTEWQHKGSNFDGKYKSGKADLTFVKRSIHEIVNVLAEADREGDPTAFIDFFSLPAPEDDPRAIRTKGSKPGKKSGSEDDDRPKSPLPLPRPPRFRVQKVRGGFSVLPGAAEAPLPKKLDIQVAYDIRKGSALKKYDTADFELNEEPIRLSPPPKGLEIATSKENRMIVDVKDRDFSLHVTGFDENRDLYVRVIVPTEDADGDSTV